MNQPTQHRIRALKHAAPHVWSMTETFLMAAAMILLTGVFQSARGQGRVNWLAMGSLQNWFSEQGCEVEEGYVQQQQYGLLWPAEYLHTDMQAAKGFWIGCTNFTDAGSPAITWPYKVVHVGPRVAGGGEFFPMKFDLYSRFDPPTVVVDGRPASRNLENITQPSDPSMKADRMIESIDNTAIGITVTRKVYQFSQQYHDNYHIYDFTFTNTGYIDNTNVQKLNQTLTGVYFYWQYRYAICAEVRYIIANNSGWGISTMNDARGFPPDASHPAIGAPDVKAQFAWNGFNANANLPTAGSAPNAATFDNIGAPIWNPSADQIANGGSGFVSLADTTWRLGGAQFVGTADIHADKSPADPSDDPAEPSTTNYIDSDNPGLTTNNSQFNSSQMSTEYAKMSQGHTARHAWVVDPTGQFDHQTVMGNITSTALGTTTTSGGISNATGYGPYTLAPGQSVHVVFVEAADGLDRDECVRIGRLYKNGAITTIQKNDSVLNTGQTRLFDTFRRAMANYNSGYSIPQPPFPPSAFTVNSGGDRIQLSWTPNPNESANGFQGYRIYRATARFDSTYYKVFECGTGTTNPTVVYTYRDTSLTRGIDYYYYITAFGSAAANTGVGNTPSGQLESSRFFTQTYVAANLKRQAGTSSDQIRIAPNPYNIGANPNSLRFPGVPDRIAFFNIPGNCLITIYSELGEKIYEIDHKDGTGDAYWNSVTSSGQVVVSGVYLVVFQNRDTGERTIKKLVVVR